MRNIVILAILILASFSLSAQTTLINNDDKDILLMSTVTGDIINIAANDSVEMLAPLNEVYYVYRRLSDSDSPQIVQKIGFCFLRVQGNRRFYERGSKMPIFIHNNSS